MSFRPCDVIEFIGSTADFLMKLDTCWRNYKFDFTAPFLLLNLIWNTNTGITLVVYIVIRISISNETMPPYIFVGAPTANIYIYTYIYIVLCKSNDIK